MEKRKIKGQGCHLFFLSYFLPFWWLRHSIFNFTYLDWIWIRSVIRLEFDRCVSPDELAAGSDVIGSRKEAYCLERRGLGNGTPPIWVAWQQRRVAQRWTGDGCHVRPSCCDWVAGVLFSRVEAGMVRAKGEIKKIKEKEKEEEKGINVHGTINCKFRGSRCLMVLPYWKYQQCQS